ncbi:unnamed protein product [Arctogadus glacialis]
MNLKKAQTRSTLTSDDEGGKRRRIPSSKLKETVPADEGEKHTRAKKKEKKGVLHKPLLSPPAFRASQQDIHKVAAHTSAALEQASAQISGNIQSQFERDHALLRAVEELKALVRQNNLLLQALTRQKTTAAAAAAADTLSEEFKFPMNCEEDLQRVEDLLREKSQEKALAAHLSALGGCNPGDAVRRILRHILTNHFALKFNWLGRGGKKLAFASYKVCNAVRGASASQNISASDCEAVIKNWLKCSGDRSGGRKRRESRVHEGPQQFSLPPPSPSPVMDDTTSSDSDDDCSSLE